MSRREPKPTAFDALASVSTCRQIERKVSMLWKDLVAELDRRVVPDNLDSLLDAGAAFKSGIAAGVLTDVFNEALSAQSSASRHLSFGNNGAVTLHKSDLFSINLMYFKGHLDHLYYEPLHTVTVIVSDCEVEATRYRVNIAEGSSEMDNKSTLKEVERKLLRKGSAWVINGRSDVSDLNSVDDQHPLLATLIGTKLSGLCWTFDRAELKSWYATSIDYEVTSMMTIADLLGRLRDRSALESLGRLYHESAHHYARWSAVKNIGRIDKNAGIEFLRKSLHDPHPEVQRAAERTLDRHGLH